jgi:uncharacterized protein DUF5667
VSDRRAPVLDALRRHPDPADSTDPRIRSVVDSLGHLDIAPAPADRFRSELRAQLVAVAPRLVEESAAAPEPAASDKRSEVVGKHAARARRSYARPLAIAASVVTVLVLVLAGATWMSQKSLPGDTLYGLKRASEDVRLSLASSSTAAAGDRLGFATTRVEEARQLVRQAGATALGRGPQASGGLNARTTRLVSDTLKSADEDLLRITPAGLCCHGPALQHPVGHDDRLGARATESTRRPRRRVVEHKPAQPGDRVRGTRQVRTEQGERLARRYRLRLRRARRQRPLRTGAVHHVSSRELRQHDAVVRRGEHRLGREPVSA